jgi:hypothetical protein
MLESVVYEQLHLIQDSWALIFMLLSIVKEDIK